MDSRKEDKQEIFGGAKVAENTGRREIVAEKESADLAARDEALQEAEDAQRDLTEASAADREAERRQRKFDQQLADQKNHTAQAQLERDRAQKMFHEAEARNLRIRNELAEQKALIEQLVNERRQLRVEVDNLLESADARGSKRKTSQNNDMAHGNEKMTRLEAQDALLVSNLDLEMCENEQQEQDQEEGVPAWIVEEPFDDEQPHGELEVQENVVNENQQIEEGAKIKKEEVVDGEMGEDLEKRTLPIFEPVVKGFVRSQIGDKIPLEHMKQYFEKYRWGSSHQTNKAVLNEAFSRFCHISNTPLHHNTVTRKRMNFVTVVGDYEAISIRRRNGGPKQKIVFEILLPQKSGQKFSETDVCQILRQFVHMATSALAEQKGYNEDEKRATDAALLKFFDLEIFENEV